MTYQPTRMELERVIALLEYERSLPHAFREEIARADFEIAAARRELARLK